MPKNAHKLDVWLEKYLKKDLTDKQHGYIDSLLNYLKQRGIGPEWYDFMYSPDMNFDFNRRLIIPFYWKGDVVGYTGRIFDDSDKVRIFGRFYRTAQARASDKTGSGLGLAIVKNLVHSLDGDVGVRNSNSGGCNFWFTVPKAQAR